jgi:hypothetical protein
MTLKSLLFCLLLLFYMTNEVYSQQLDAEVIKYTTTCDVGFGKLTETDSITIQINNRVGDKYAEIELSFSKLNRIACRCLD